MNRRKLFVYLGSAAVAASIALPVMASVKRRHFTMLYTERLYALDDGPKRLWRGYDMKVTFADGRIQYLGIDALDRDDAWHRTYLERKITRMEEEHGAARDSFDDYILSRKTEVVHSDIV